MSRLQQILWAIIVVLVLAGGYLWWASSQNVLSTTPTVATNSQETTSSSQTPATSGSNVDQGTGASGGVSVGSSAPMKATVTYNGSSFSPTSVTIAKGGTVTFVSNAGDMWVASNPHPSHTGYDGTSRSQHCASGYTGAAPFDQCTSGTTYSLVFNQVGTWGYHNHLDDGARGSVTVVSQ